ncbi:hypothetical protein ACEQ8H_008519 [Pleosporales sp. CAS-2024a]
MSSRVEEMKRERDSWKRRAQDQAAEMEAKCQTLQGENAQLKAMTEPLREKNGQLTVEVGKWKASWERKQMELDHATKDVERWKGEAAARVSASRNEASGLQAEFDQKKMAYEHLVSEHEHLVSEHEHLVKEHEQQAGDKEKLAKERDLFSAQSIQWKAECEKMEIELNKAMENQRLALENMQLKSEKSKDWEISQTVVKTQIQNIEGLLKYEVAIDEKLVVIELHQHCFFQYTCSIIEIT